MGAIISLVLILVIILFHYVRKSKNITPVTKQTVEFKHTWALIVVFVLYNMLHYTNYSSILIRGTYTIVATLVFIVLNLEYFKQRVLTIVDNCWKMLFWLAIYSIGFIIFTLLYDYIIVVLFKYHDQNLNNLSNNVQKTFGVRIIFMFAAGIFGPIFEELFFRVTTWKLLKKLKLKNWVILIITATLFGLSHLQVAITQHQFISQLPQVGPYIFWGLVSGYSKIKTKNESYMYSNHILWNIMGAF